MRPRRIRRGKRSRVRHGAVRPADASMRPRRIRRGKAGRPFGITNGPLCFNEAPANSPGKAAESESVHVLECLASMRPRRIRRGKGTASSSRSRARGCFNEAPANSPGKAGVSASPGRRPTSFNEAPANSPGKGAPGQVPEFWHGTRPLASAAADRLVLAVRGGRFCIQIVKERASIQGVMAFRALPGVLHAPERSRDGRQT